MRALVDYPSDLGVQEQGFRALSALNAIKAQGAENQGRAFVAGAVEVRRTRGRACVWGGGGAMAGGRSVARRSLFALRLLICVQDISLRQMFHAHPSTQAIAAALLAHRSSAAVTQQALAALANLVAGNDEYKARRSPRSFPPEGGVP